VVAELRVVCSHSIAQAESFNFGSNSSNYSNSLMAWDERKLGDELALVDMLVIM
jgi:hypothetical protein